MLLHEGRMEAKTGRFTFIPAHVIDFLIYAFDLVENLSAGLAFRRINI